MNTRGSLPSPLASRNLATAVWERPESGYRARRCTGCGRTDVEVAEFRCVWSDARTTTEWHCEACVRVWQPQLRALGGRIERVGPASSEQ